MLQLGSFLLKHIVLCECDCHSHTVLEFIVTAAHNGKRVNDVGSECGDSVDWIENRYGGVGCQL